MGSENASTIIRFPQSETATPGGSASRTRVTEFEAGYPALVSAQARAVAVDFDGTLTAYGRPSPVAWSSSLRLLGPCEITLLHSYDSVREWSRFGIAGRPVVDGSAEIDTILVRDLKARAADVLSERAVEVRAVASLDWTAETLASTAEREGFDVIVVGGHRRGGYARIAHRAQHDAREASELEQGDERALRGLVPEEGERRGIETETRVVHEGKPGEATRRTAELLGVEVICLGTHGRSGLSRLLGGSVAREMATRSPRPLLLVHPAAAE